MQKEALEASELSTILCFALKLAVQVRSPALCPSLCYSFHCSTLALLLHYWLSLHAFLELAADSVGKDIANITCDVTVP